MIRCGIPVPSASESRTSASSTGRGGAEHAGADRPREHLQRRGAQGAHGCLIRRLLRAFRGFIGSRGSIGKLAIFANFWRARSRLYQNEILQENMRLTAFVNLYMMCTLLHRSKLNILEKIGLQYQQFS